MSTLDHVTAVVANWRTPELTVRAVAALTTDGLPPERVVAVDDGGADEEQLRGELGGSLVVALPESVGYARANNHGARALPGAAYLLVNSDAFVARPGSVRALVDELADPRVGIVAARLLNPDGSIQPNVAPLPSPAVAAVQATGLSRLIPYRW